MQVVKISAPTILGLVVGPDHLQLRLNQKEIAALQRAIDIREEARDRLRDGMGDEEYEMSNLYVLHCDDLVDTPVINFAYNHSRRSI